MSPDVSDRLARPLRDLRISVTDRCNFRCRYCMPRESFGADHEFLPRKTILSFEDFLRVARVASELGMRKIRITGGEPLLRRDLPTLIGMLSQIPDIEVALTTNGALLSGLAEPLAEAGLTRVTVSLDSIDEAVFQAMNDVHFPVSRVLEGIDAAARAGLGPIKVNAMVRRGVNEDAIVDLARHFRGSGHIVRFIEFMDVGVSNGWRPADVVPGGEIVERITAEFPAEPTESQYRGEVASRWRYRDGEGEFGVITSVTAPFCRDCTRARLSAKGVLYTCLFATGGTDLRQALRNAGSDGELRKLMTEAWLRRDDRYSEERSTKARRSRRIEMSYIGG